MLKYIQIFYKPGIFVEEMIQDPSAHKKALSIAFLFSCLQSFPFLMQGVSHSANESNSDGFIGLKVLIGGCIGLGIFYLYSILLRNFARVLRTEAELNKIRTALGLALLPWTVLFFVFFMLMAIVGPSVVYNLFPIFFFGIIYGYTVLLISVSRTLKIGSLKAFFLLTFTKIVILFPVIFLFQKISIN
tara:strand:- start:192 stop:755 length:564 start_codon:yes stop_codon:yes gene_type:complete